jgi:putative DNA methylase
MTQTYKKKLIEVAIPLEVINKHAEKEKDNPFIKGHPRSLHQWWARRPNSTVRAILFAQMIDDPSCDKVSFSNADEQQKERIRIFSLIDRACGWGGEGDSDAMSELCNIASKSMGEDINAINCYDPFCGGGSIPLEAKRIGLKSFASDLNPIAALITAGQISLPTKFYGRSPISQSNKANFGNRGLQGVASDIVHYAKIMQERAKYNIGNYYPDFECGSSMTVPSAYIWARTVPCPDPAFSGLQTPLIRSFSISTKKGKNIWLEPVKCQNGIIFNIKKEPLNKFPGVREPSVGKSGGTCLISGAAMPLPYIREMAEKGHMKAQLVAVICDLQSGRTAFPGAEEPFISQDIISSVPSIDLPDRALGFRVQQYGMHDFKDIFSDRQKLCLHTFSNLIKDMHSQIIAEYLKASHDENEAVQYANIISMYLQMCVSKMADYNNTISCWNNTNMNITHLFTKHAIPMSWDYSEINPFGNLMSFVSIATSVAKSVESLPPGVEGSVFQHDAGDHQENVKNALISTDPPYYDNIGYADLSDIFYLWARDNMTLFGTSVSRTLATPKTEEAIASPFRHKSKEEAEQWFMNKIKSSMREICLSARQDAPVTIYYAFKQKEIAAEGISSPGWVSFLDGVISSGLRVVATWPIRTERATRSVGIGKNALASSVVLVCRPRSERSETITRAEFIRIMKKEIHASLADLQAASITPSDMPQSAIGPGMGVFSRYKAVLESDDSPMSVRTALQLINRELDEYLGGIQGEFDADTRFAITWFEQNGMTKGEYGIASSIAQARGITVESVKHAGIVESAAGSVRILKRDEMTPNWSPAGDPHLTVWECCQYLIHALETRGEYDAAILLKKIGPEKADAVKDLAYCLYGICEKRNDAKEATSYNALIAVWTELTRQAAAIQDTRMNVQASLDL